MSASFFKKPGYLKPENEIECAVSRGKLLTSLT